MFETYYNVSIFFLENIKYFIHIIILFIAIGFFLGKKFGKSKLMKDKIILEKDTIIENLKEERKIIEEYFQDELKSTKNLIEEERKELNSKIEEAREEERNKLKQKEKYLEEEKEKLSKFRNYLIELNESLEEKEKDFYSKRNKYLKEIKGLKNKLEQVQSKSTIRKNILKGVWKILQQENNPGYAKRILKKARRNKVF